MSHVIHICPFFILYVFQSIACVASRYAAKRRLHSHKFNLKWNGFVTEEIQIGGRGCKRRNNDVGNQLVDYFVLLMKRVMLTEARLFVIGRCMKKRQADTNALRAEKYISRNMFRKKIHITSI